jgi:acyl carrier protein
MNNEKIRDLIRNFIVETFYLADEGDLQNDRSLSEAGIVDSTGVLEVIGFVEREFEIQVEDHEMVPENLDTVAGIVRYVIAKTAT